MSNRAAWQLTIELLEHALHGAGAAAAGHGDVELVVVFGHFEMWFDKCGLVGVEGGVVVEVVCEVGEEQGAAL
jgi:hypothetical protein